MNLRKVGQYNIGLDIGTGSVGWAVTDESGELCYFKGKPTWGSRVFPGAQSAAEARSFRGLRRRYTRRKWRLNLLQELFARPIEACDPEFFVRMNQASLFPEDRDEAYSTDYRFALFNDDDFNEKDYFAKFPTIYHLREWLMKTTEQADIRLIYLAFHNIVKHRGNFLQQERIDLNSRNANVDAAVDEFCAALEDYCVELGASCDVFNHEEALKKALSDTNSSRSHVKENIQKTLGISADALGVLDKAAVNNMTKALSAALVGLNAEMSNIFFIGEEKPEGGKTKIYLSKDEDVESFQEICPELGIPLFEAMKKVYSSFVLQEILSSVPGQSISVNKVAEYEKYAKDLKLLKQLVKQYAPAQYDEFFRGKFYAPTDLHPQKTVYNKSEAKGYTKYNEDHGWPYDEFKKAIEKLFAGTGAVDDPRYQEMANQLAEGRFLRRLKISDNGAIPFQLHLEEMNAIIANQSQYYPFLEAEKEKINSLVTFRIPYYVGPLTQVNARKDSSGVNRFAWSKRLEGKENAAVKPWNWETIIDKDASATEFIQRMTGTCTYLQDEPVLPKCSLLYEEYCVLNELNGATFSQDGDSWTRFDYKDREDIVHDLFRQGKVSYKKVSEWMMRERGHAHVHVRGGQGESGFESKLGSYIFFAKDVFHVDEIPESDYPMIEEIILWSTLFEDRSIFKEKLERKYGERLSSEQIKKIVKKRFAGWGRLSKKLLVGLKANTDNGPMSIMDVLRDGNPNNDRLSKAMVFMEILSDDNLGFKALIDEHNREKLLDADTLQPESIPGSPALRRSINQTIKIVDEIVRIAGHAPANIFIEVAREDDLDKRGTRTQRRYDRLKDAMKKLKEESPEQWNSSVAGQLSEYASAKIDLDERLTLYFMQGGKSLYSGLPLEIGRLSGYEVDHILPQSYIKDDSFDKKALVLKEENQNKSNQMLLSSDMQRKMKSYWEALLQAGLISEKKFKNLTREKISDKQMKSFIARQLVETRQSIKLIQDYLKVRYTDTQVLSVKSGLSHELREKLELPKCREINDFHHAHDALLASEIGRFICKRHPKMYENPIGYTRVMESFIKKESDRVRRGYAPGTTTFIISSFLKSGFDEETGELFKDDWSAGEECNKLRRYFNYRQCFISRMPEETSGAFWNQTIYSPRLSNMTMNLPLKKGLDPAKYGSYSSEQFAYFFIYKALKKNKEVLEFAPVPVSVASDVKQNEEALEEYAMQLALNNSLTFIEIVRPKIYKYQVIEIEGSRLYLTGKKEVRNATQFAFSVAETAIAQALFDEGQCVQDNLLDELFLSVVESLIKYSPRVFSALSVDSWKDRFFSLETSDREAVLKALITIGNGKANKVDITAVGGAKYAGTMLLSFSKILSKEKGITFIDQSVTGMFERRVHIGL